MLTNRNNMIAKILFGRAKKGEKLPLPKPIKERPLDPLKFQKWCQEMRVSSAYVKKFINY